MGVFRADIEVQTSWNETLEGVLYIDPGAVMPGGQNSSGGPGRLSNFDRDPVGASYYVIAVVLVYGLSIVFLIGSHVALRPRKIDLDTEKQITRFLEMTPTLQENTRKEYFKNLKYKVIPVVASSSAKALVNRRKSFLPYLGGMVAGGVRKSIHHIYGGERRPSLLGATSGLGPSERASSGMAVSERVSLRADPGLEAIREDQDEEDSDSETPDPLFMGHVSTEAISEQNRRMRAQVANNKGQFLPGRRSSLTQFPMGLGLLSMADSEEEWDSGDQSSDAEILPAITIPRASLEYPQTLRRHLPDTDIRDLPTVHISCTAQYKIDRALTTNSLFGCTKPAHVSSPAGCRPPGTRAHIDISVTRAPSDMRGTGVPSHVTGTQAPSDMTDNHGPVRCDFSCSCMESTPWIRRSADLNV